MTVPRRDMITFSVSGHRFTMRVVAIILRGQDVLLNRDILDDFWVLPGGRAELMEPAVEGIKREVREELGVEAEVERLALVVENLFEYMGEPHHSLELFFVMRLPEGCSIYTESEEFTTYTDDGGRPLHFKWFPLEELPRVRLLPAFLRQKLASLPESTEHLVHRDEDNKISESMNSERERG